MNFHAGFTGEEFEKLLGSEPQFPKAAVKRAGRELAAALGKPSQSSKRKLAAEVAECEGEGESEKVEPRHSARQRLKGDRE